MGCVDGILAWALHVQTTEWSLQNMVSVEKSRKKTSVGKDYRAVDELQSIKERCLSDQKV